MVGPPSGRTARAVIVPRTVRSAAVGAVARVPHSLMANFVARSFLRSFVRLLLSLAPARIGGARAR
jgi:hypothetical protein